MKSSLRVLAIAVAFAFSTLAALAANATLSVSANVYDAPGGSVVGSLNAGTQVYLGNCNSGWCNVKDASGFNGWVQQDALIFSAPQPQPQPQPLPQPQPWPQPQPLPHPQPWPQPQPPRPPQPPVYEEAGACFYSERNFGGYSFCLEEGDSYDRLRNWNDRIRSVEIFGGAHVDLCSGENLRGSCMTLRSDASRLPSQLDRRASSVEVY